MTELEEKLGDWHRRLCSVTGRIVTALVKRQVTGREILDWVEWADSVTDEMHAYVDKWSKAQSAPPRGAVGAAPRAEKYPTQEG